MFRISYFFCHSISAFPLLLNEIKIPFPIPRTADRPMNNNNIKWYRQQESKQTNSERKKSQENCQFALIVQHFPHNHRRLFNLHWHAERTTTTTERRREQKKAESLS